MVDQLGGTCLRETDVDDDDDGLEKMKDPHIDCVLGEEDEKGNEFMRIDVIRCGIYVNF